MIPCTSWLHPTLLTRRSIGAVIPHVTMPLLGAEKHVAGSEDDVDAIYSRSSPATALR
jgi:hypothetical protein